MWRPSFQDAANGIYRQTARLVAAALGSSPIVESVLVHRSVASGEVCFGRSDIDLVLVIRPPVADDGDAGHLRELLEKVRFLRRIIPALGHLEVHDAQGLEEWLRIDTYRASLDRRSALLLWGKSVAMPSLLVLQRHAARHFALQPHYFLAAAVRQGNRRNLRKIALEMWNACATATGMISEPFLTRRQTEEFCLAAGEPFPCDLWRNSRSALRFMFQTARQLHAKLLLPLQPLRESLVFRAPLPPSFSPTTFVVLPGADAEMPPEAFETRSVIVTPELLDLYIQFANAFAHWILPPKLEELGFGPPDLGSFIQTCRHEFHSHWSRNPGFVNSHSGRPNARMFTFRHGVECLEKGQAPPPADREEAGRMAALRPSVNEYYESHYCGVLREQEQLWKRLGAVYSRNRSLTCSNV